MREETSTEVVDEKHLRERGQRQRLKLAQERNSYKVCWVCCTALPSLPDEGLRPSGEELGLLLALHLLRQLPTNHNIII